MKDKIKEILEDSIGLKQKLIADYIDVIENIARKICHCLKNGGKLIVFGNGGSAADSQHIVAELVGRFQKERKAYPAIALSTNTSTLTAVANDYGYEEVFRRQLEAVADTKDIALAISTSGKARNVNQAVKFLRAKNIKTIALSGKDGGELAKIADTSLVVPSNITARIQEIHITIGHIICALVEEEIST